MSMNQFVVAVSNTLLAQSFTNQQMFYQEMAILESAWNMDGFTNAMHNADQRHIPPGLIQILKQKLGVS